MFYLIADTRYSVTITPCWKDFIEYIKYKTPTTLQRVSGNVEVTHEGIVQYQFLNKAGTITKIKTIAHHNLHINARLFSPQAYFKVSNDRDFYLL